MRRSFDILRKPEENSVSFAPSISAAAPAPATPVAPIRPALRAAAHDEIVKLVQRLFIIPDVSAAPRIVAFSGIEPGDGCSWVCVHAAQMLAEQVAGAVCVVDANLRSPALHRRFQCENRASFATSVENQRSACESAQKLPGRNLSLVPAGSAGLGLADVVKPLRLKSFMSELRQDFDYIILDTPPLSAYNDSVLIGQATDGIVLVVGSNSTHRETARIAKESLEAAGVPVLGAVLNKRTFPIPERLYRKL